MMYGIRVIDLLIDGADMNYNVIKENIIPKYIILTYYNSLRMELKATQTNHIQNNSELNVVLLF